jgi:hypothetical protein
VTRRWGPRPGREGKARTRSDLLACGCGGVTAAGGSADQTLATHPDENRPANASLSATVVGGTRVPSACVRDTATSPRCLGHDAAAVAQHGPIRRHTATFALWRPAPTRAGICKQVLASVRNSGACLKIVVSPVRVRSRHSRVFLQMSGFRLRSRSCRCRSWRVRRARGLFRGLTPRSTLRRRRRLGSVELLAGLVDEPVERRPVLALDALLELGVEPSGARGNRRASWHRSLVVDDPVDPRVQPTTGRILVEWRGRFAPRCKPRRPRAESFAYERDRRAGACPPAGAGTPPSTNREATRPPMLTILLIVLVLLLLLGGGFGYRRRGRRL